MCLNACSCDWGRAWMKEVGLWGQAFEGDTQPVSCLAPCLVGHHDESCLCQAHVSPFHHNFLLGQAEPPETMSQGTYLRDNQRCLQVSDRHPEKHQYQESRDEARLSATCFPELVSCPIWSLARHTGTSQAWLRASSVHHAEGLQLREPTVRRAANSGRQSS